MNINAEVISQVLDAVAFLFVTPEFLRDDTLKSVRKFILDALRNDFGGFWVGTNDDVPLRLKILKFVAFALAMVLVFGAGNFIETRLEVGSSLEIAVRVSFLFLVMFLLMQLFISVIDMAVSLIIRRVLFVCGVFMFFAARGIAIWHSWTI